MNFLDKPHWSCYTYIVWVRTRARARAFSPFPLQNKVSTEALEYSPKIRPFYSSSLSSHTQSIALSSINYALSSKVVQVYWHILAIYSIGRWLTQAHSSADIAHTHTHMHRNILVPINDRKTATTQNWYNFWVLWWHHIDTCIKWFIWKMTSTFTIWPLLHTTNFDWSETVCHNTVKWVECAKMMFNCIDKSTLPTASQLFNMKRFFNNFVQILRCHRILFRSLRLSLSSSLVFVFCVLTFIAVHFVSNDSHSILVGFLHRSSTECYQSPCVLRSGKTTWGRRRIAERMMRGYM